MVLNPPLLFLMLKLVLVLLVLLLLLRPDGDEDKANPGDAAKRDLFFFAGLPIMFLEAVSNP